MQDPKTSTYRFESRREQFRLLIGIGLVSAGLLAGIFFMLLAYPPAPRGSQFAEIRLVERASSDEEAMESEMSALPVPGDAFRDVARRTVQSVVSINVESSWSSRFWSPSDSDSEMFRENEGSGVVITPQGHIVTSYHLVEDAGKLQIRFADKREYEAYTVGVDPSTDLAVIQIVLRPGERVAPITVGDSETVQLGDWVLAVGNPLQLNSTVTAGIVSALGRSMNIIDESFGVEAFIQTDAAINPGSSGGALVNLSGELIGINTAIATDSGFYEGYGFAIPVNLMIRVASDLIEFGEFRRGYIGVVPTNVHAKLARALGMTTIQGVFIDQIYGGSAAEIAGLQPGDVIVAINGQPVNEPNELQSIIMLQRPNSTVEVAYWREGRVDSLQLTLLGRDHPKVASWLAEMGYYPRREVSTARYLDQWGLVLRDKWGEEDEKRFGNFEGVIIQRVMRQEEIEHLQANVLLERINGEEINSVEQAVRMLNSAGESVRLTIRDKWNVPRMVNMSELKG